MHSDLLGKSLVTVDIVHLLFSKEAVIVTKIDEGPVIESIAAETVSNSKALERQPDMEVSCGPDHPHMFW